MYELRIEDSFAAAHRLVDYQGDCEHLHGHNWTVEVVVVAEKLDSRGLAIDFRDLKDALHQVIAPLDHRFLNDLAPFMKENPSSEKIAQHIFEELERLLKGHAVDLHEVRVWESSRTSAAYRRSHHPR